MELNLLTIIPLVLLSLDTIRAIIAMLGWVNPNSKYAFIIYGRYRQSLLQEVFNELGFSNEKKTHIIQSIKKIAKETKEGTGINKENAELMLLILLAKYMVKFATKPQYNDELILDSQYFIDTMEMSHNENDLNQAVAIMTNLICKKIKKFPSVVIAPKNGNPLFALATSKSLQSRIVFAKAKNDKTRISCDVHNEETVFRINYEGSWPIEKKGQSIIVDCNAITGTQLLNIIEDLASMKQAALNANIAVPQLAFVLFLADSREDINANFKNHGCELIRYFDLNESIKGELYKLKEEMQNRSSLGFYYPECRDRAKAILAKLH